MAEDSYIVTGAAGGMGSEAVRHLALRGVNVLCVDRDEESLKALADGLPPHEGDIVCHVADVTEREQVEAYVTAAVDRWGGLAGAFHIAGHEGVMRRFVDADIDEFDRMIAINARSVWYGMKYVVPHLLARGGGSIVNTGSYVASHGTQHTSPYGAAKHAVVGITRGVAVELAALDIRVNVLAPGAMDTRMIRTLWTQTSPDDPARGHALTVGRIPRGKLADPANVAKVGVFLLLDAPPEMTGQIVSVDGARSA